MRSRRLAEGMGLLLAGLLLSGSAVADTVTLRADSWCPYNCVPGKGPEGYIIDVARAVLSARGHTVDYATMPFDEALVAATEGRITGVPGVSNTDGRGLLFPRLPLGFSGNVMAVARGRGFTFSGAESLKTLKIGAIESYSYGDIVDAHIAASKGTPAVTLVSGDHATGDLIKLLLDKKVDGIVEDATVIEYTLSQMGMDGLFDLIPVSEKSQIFLVFSPKVTNGQALADALDAGVAELRASGRLAEILRAYGLKDWQK